jgi:ubiquitin C-terminal hydrolase
MGNVIITAQQFPSIESSIEENLLRSNFIGKSWKWIKENIFLKIESLVNFIFNHFEIFDPRSFSLDALSTKLLKKVSVIQANTDITQTPLLNLGATCYINSCLHLIANCNSFNTLFEIKLKENDETRLKTKQALQDHLGHIIHKIRQGLPDHSITYNDLKTFFSLCQALGWYKTAKTSTVQSDANEFLIFLLDVLEMDTKDYLSLNFGLTPNNDQTLENQLSDLLNQDHDVENTFLNDLPPNFVIINESRAHLSPAEGLIRVNSQISAPESLNIKNGSKNVTYQFKGVIFHHSKKPSGGHYTVATKFNDQRLMHYNDKKEPQLINIDDAFEQMATTFIYELSNTLPILDIQADLLS